MPYLDMIVPHYKEPWSTGEKFFEMLRLQRGVNFDDFRVILVQDGEEGKLPKSIFKGYPYQVKQITIQHQGVSAARNRGIKAATAPWVAFCDFDDMYSSVLSLKVALEALKKAERDGIVYLWNRFLEEGHDQETGDYMLYKHQWDATFVHGRFIQRQFIIDNGLRFNPSLSFGEDSDFNFIAQTVAGQNRIGEVKEPIYIWCENGDSVTRRENDKTVFYAKMLQHRFATAEELDRRGIEREYQAAVVRNAVDCYYEMNSDKATENVKKCEGMFAAWWMKNKAVFYTATAKLVGSIMNTVRANAYRTGACMVERVTLADWLAGIEKKYGGQ